MNQIFNKFLLAGDKSMPEMHLKQPRFTYSTCGPITRNKQRIQKFMQTGDKNYIYRNELDKACFQHDVVYDKYKDIQRRTQSDKVLKDKSFEIVNDPKYDGYQRGLASMVYKFFDKKRKELVLKMKLKKINNQLMNFVSQVLGSLKNKSVFFF